MKSGEKRTTLPSLGPTGSGVRKEQRPTTVRIQHPDSQTDSSLQYSRPVVPCEGSQHLALSPPEATTKVSEARERVLEVYETSTKASMEQRAGLPSEDDLDHLVNELVFLFIATFHQDTMTGWKILLETLLHLQPVCKHLQDFPQVEHYIKRIRYHASVKVEKTFMQKMLGIIATLFPEIAGNGMNTSTRSSYLRVPQGQQRSTKVSPATSPFHAQKMFLDLAKPNSTTSPRSPLPSPNSTTLLNLMAANFALPKSMDEVLDFHNRPDHISPNRLFYLVPRTSLQFDPYDLVVVPKSRILQHQQVYFIVSKTEIVRVEPDGQMEHWTHASWQEEARLFHSLTSLPTFKNFLLRTAFDKWREFSQKSSTLRWRQKLVDSSLWTSPHLLEPLRQLMQAVTAISDCQVIQLNVEEDMGEYMVERCATLKPQLFRSLLDIQSALAQARRKVLGSLDLYRTFRKHPALRKKQSLYLSKEDRLRRKHLVDLSSQVERMHRLAFHLTSSHVIWLLERCFTVARHGPPFQCTLALRKVDQANGQAEVFLDADLSELRDQLSSIVQILTQVVAETLVDCEIKNKHKLMFGDAESTGVKVSVPFELPECFTTYQSFMSRLSKQISTTGFVGKNLRNVDDQLEAASRFVRHFVRFQSPLQEMTTFLHMDRATAVARILASPVESTQSQCLQIRDWQEWLSSQAESFVTDPAVLAVNWSKLRNQLLFQTGDFVQQLTDAAAQEVNSVMPSLVDSLKENIQKMQVAGFSWSDYINHTMERNETLEQLGGLRKFISVVENLFLVVITFLNPMPEEMETQHLLVHSLWTSLAAALRVSRHMLEQHREKALEEMDAAYRHAYKSLGTLVEVVNEGIFVDSSTTTGHVMQEFEDISAQFRSSLAICQKIAAWKSATPGVLLKLPPIEVLTKQLEARREVWREYSVAVALHQKWLKTHITQSSLSEVEVQVQAWHERADALQSYLPVQDKVLAGWQKIVDRWRKLLPLWRDLLLIGDNHEDWSTVLRGLGWSGATHIFPGVTLQTLLSCGLESQAGWVSQACKLLSRRRILFALIRTIREHWANCVLATGPSYAEIINLYPVITSLEEHRIQLQSLVGIVWENENIKSWLVFLNEVEDFLHTLSSCQAKDLISQLAQHPFVCCHVFLPGESCQDRGTIRQVYLEDWLQAHQLEAYQSPCQEPGRLTLVEHARHLEREQLELCLEQEEILSADWDLFPRLYLLSLEERLAFQAQAADNFFSVYTSIFLRTCFPALDSISISRDDKGNSWILWLHSREESFPVSDAPPVADTLSLWLSSLQSASEEALKTAMLTVLGKMAKSKDLLQGLEEIEAQGDPPPPSQVLFVAAGTFWTRCIENALKDGKANKMESLRQNMSKTRAALVKKVQMARNGEIRARVPQLVGLLYQLDYYLTHLQGADDQFNWELVLQYHTLPEELKFRGVAQTPFPSVRDLRYRGRGTPLLPRLGLTGSSAQQAKSVAAVRDVCVRCGGVERRYGYEYVGPSLSYGVAPLLERTAFLVSSALQQSPALTAGQAGHWQAHLIDSLAKLLGKTCFTVECLPTSELSRILSSLLAALMTGAWLVLTDFHVLPEGKASVCKQQFQHLTQSIARCQSQDCTADQQPIVFLGKTVSVHRDFWFCLTSSTPIQNNLFQFRHVSLVEPDCGLLLECWLGVGSFTHLRPLAKKILHVLAELKQPISLRSLKSVSALAIERLQKLRSELVLDSASLSTENDTDFCLLTDDVENVCVSSALETLLSPSLEGTEKETLYRALANTFPIQQQRRGAPAILPLLDADWVLRANLEDALKETGVRPHAQFLDKCMQLHSVLQWGPLILQVGPPGSGKSLSRLVLSKALQRGERSGGGQLSTQVFFPGAHSYSEVSSWFLKCSEETGRPEAKSVQRWKILDGQMDEPWAQHPDLLVACHRLHDQWEQRSTRCTLPSCHLWIETADLKSVSPSFLSLWSLVYYGSDTLPWEVLLHGYLHNLPLIHKLTFSEISTLESWLVKLIPECLSCVVNGQKDDEKVQLGLTEPVAVSIFLQVLGAVFYHFLDKRNENDAGVEKTPNWTLLKNCTAFALLWGFGSALSSKDKLLLEASLRDCLLRIVPDMDLPSGNRSMFDFVPEPGKGLWEHLANPGLSTETTYVDRPIWRVTSPFSGFPHVVSMVWKSGRQVLLTGSPGTGKTVLLKNLCPELRCHGGSSRENSDLYVGLSEAVGKQDLRDLVRKWASAQGSRLRLLADDLHMSTHNQEVLRSWIWSGHFAMACTSRNKNPSRLYRLFVTFNLPDPSERTLVAIYRSPTEKWLSAGFRGLQVISADIVQILLEANLGLHLRLSGEGCSLGISTWHHLHRSCSQLVLIQPPDTSPSSLLFCWTANAALAWQSLSHCHQGAEHFWTSLEEAAWEMSRCAPSLLPSGSSLPPRTSQSVFSQQGVKTVYKVEHNVDYLSDRSKVCQMVRTIREGYVLLPNLTDRSSKLNCATNAVLRRTRPLETSHVLSDIRLRVLSELSQAISLPGGHCLLTSDDGQWSGKRSLVLGAARHLNYQVVRLDACAVVEDKTNDQRFNKTLVTQIRWELQSENQSCSLSRPTQFQQQEMRRQQGRRHSQVMQVITSGRPTKRGLAPMSYRGVTSGTTASEVSSNISSANSITNTVAPAHQQQVMIGRTAINGQIQECLQVAGVKGQPVVFLVSVGRGSLEGDCGRHLYGCLQSLVCHGDCKWLNSLRGLDGILHFMQLLFWNKTSSDRTLLYHKFLARVRSNLHLVICCEPLQVAHTLFRVIAPNLAAVIHVLPFTDSDAKQFLENLFREKNVLNEDEIEEVSKSVSQVHILAKQLLPARKLGAADLKNVVLWINTLYQMQLERSKPNIAAPGLQRLAELQESVRSCQEESRPLHVRRDRLENTIDKHQEDLDHCDNQLAQLQSECSLLEESLGCLRSRLETLQDSVAERLSDTDEEYSSALKQLLMLIPSRLQELKSYRLPPAPVGHVLSVFAALFGAPQTYEGAKQFLFSEYLPTTLQTFDRDAVSTEIHSELSKFVKDPLFRVEVVAQSSEAASALCRWIHSVYAYLDLKLSLKEEYREMSNIDSTMQERDVELNEKRVRIEEIENRSNTQRQELSELSKDQISLETVLDDLKKKTDKGNEVLSATEWFSDYWSNSSKDRPISAQAIACAACAINYSTYMDRDNSVKFLKQCEEATDVEYDEPFWTVVAKNYVKDETIFKLKLCGLPTDEVSLVNFLCLWTMINKSCWNVVLLSDPLDLAMRYLSFILNTENGTEGSLASYTADEPLLVEQVSSQDEKCTVLVQEVELLDPVEWYQLLASCKGKTFLQTTLNTSQAGALLNYAQENQVTVFKMLDLNSDGMTDFIFEHLLRQMPHLNQLNREWTRLELQRMISVQEAELEVLSMIQNEEWDLARMHYLSSDLRDLHKQRSEAETKASQATLPYLKVASWLEMVHRVASKSIRENTPAISLEMEWLANGLDNAGRKVDELNLEQNALLSMLLHLSSVLDVFNMERFLLSLAAEVSSQTYETSPEEVHLLLTAYQDEQEIHNHIDKERPPWISETVWHHLLLLQDKIPKFRRTLSAVSTDCSFDRLLTAEDVADLTPTQSALLSMAIEPERSNEIQQNFVSSVLDRNVLRHFRLRPASVSLSSLLCAECASILVYFDQSSLACTSDSHPVQIILSLQKVTNVDVFRSTGDPADATTLACELDKCSRRGEWLVLVQPHQQLFSRSVCRTLRTVLHNRHNAFRLWSVMDTRTACRLPRATRIFTRHDVD